ncbi:MAG: 4Fe-4S ferredoxin [Bacillota bacterium]|nr:MAG: 4Fe-4S ferredoxin [Bacillota bacterium]
MTMNLKQIVESLGLRVLVGGDLLDRMVSGGYVSDMLSDVLANGTVDCLWITRQSHQNVIAVASLLGLAGVILVNCPEPAPALVEKAKEEGVALLMYEGTTFELVGTMYEEGLRGCKRA